MAKTTRVTPVNDTQQGVITGFQGSFGSGIATLSVDGVPVYCENGPTVQALNACFGCIADGHTVDVSALIGQTIAYTTDDLGMLESFAPAGGDEL